MTFQTFLAVLDAMKHGMRCWAEYHPGKIVNHGGAGWYEILCAKASQASGWRLK